MFVGRDRSKTPTDSSELEHELETIRPDRMRCIRSYLIREAGTQKKCFIFIYDELFIIHVNRYAAHNEPASISDLLLQQHMIRLMHDFIRSDFSIQIHRYVYENGKSMRWMGEITNVSQLGNDNGKGGGSGGGGEEQKNTPEIESCNLSKLRCGIERHYCLNVLYDSIRAQYTLDLDSIVMPNIFFIFMSAFFAVCRRTDPPLFFFCRTPRRCIYSLALVQASHSSSERMLSRQPQNRLKTTNCEHYEQTNEGFFPCLYFVCIIPISNRHTWTIQYST